MVRTRKTSSLLSKYSKLYEKNPGSRVFAPLAESYRKLGMVEEALSILKDGLKRHPTYVMGYTVLANCHYDLHNYELAYNTIRPFVSDNLENISLQKLFANICVNLGYLEEALQTFKYLLLINPKDDFVSEQVKLLEDDLLIKETPPVAPKKSAPNFSDSEDEWVQVDFNKPSEAPKEDELDSWNMEAPKTRPDPPVANPLSSFREAIKKNDLNIEEHSLDDDYYYEEYDDESAAKIEQEEAAEEPIITHTLVDLYIRQGHMDKAAKLLESILELHPDDKPTAEKLAQIKEARPTEEETGDAPDLAHIVEEKTRDGRDRSLKTLENKLNIFLQKIKRESKRRLEAQ